MAKRKTTKRIIESESEEETIVVSSEESASDSSIYTNEYTDEEVEEGRSFEVPDNSSQSPIRKYIRERQNDIQWQNDIQRQKDIHNYICQQFYNGQQYYERPYPSTTYLQNKRHECTKDTYETPIKKMKFTMVNKNPEQILENIKSKLLEVESFTSNIEMATISHFDAIVTQIHIQREKIKGYIDDYSDRILEKVKLNQEEAIGKIKSIPVDENLKLLKTDVGNIGLMVQASEINLFDLKVKANKLSLQLDERLHVAKNNSAIYDYHEFSPSSIVQADNIHDYFGRCTHKPKTTSSDYSAILSPYNLVENLIRLCNFQSVKYLKLIYRATRDGFKSSDFHLKCDSSNETITVIKSKYGCIFGGYTQKSWRPPEKAPFTKFDSAAFIFSLVNNTKTTVKCAPSMVAIKCQNNLGPCFGIDDISICSDSNVRKKSSSNLLNCYTHVLDLKSKNLKSVVITPDFFTGSKYFETWEIETFEVQNSQF